MLLTLDISDDDYSGIWIAEDKRHPGKKPQVELRKIADTIEVWLDVFGKINTLTINGATLTDKDGVKSISNTVGVITFPNLTLTKQSTVTII